MRFLEHIVLPTIITEPGRYITRCGEVVTITQIGKRTRTFAALGIYPNQVADSWDVSGRLYRNTPSDNDIVQKAG